MRVLSMFDKNILLLQYCKLNLNIFSSFQGFTEARKEQLDVLKLALTKNLAKAILQEGTVKVV
jgi:2-hydroxy-3-keto-5-methylthiopentenyl-1-phosphate phosphatase